MQERLKTTPRGITLTDGIELMRQLKVSGHADDFSIPQHADPDSGKKWQAGSASKGTFAAKFWVEILGNAPFETFTKDNIRDALEVLPRLPKLHSKTKSSAAAAKDLLTQIEEADSEEQRLEREALEALTRRGQVTAAEREKASLDAYVPRIRSETLAKHRGYIKSVGKMLYDLQLIDHNPFEICGVTNKQKTNWAKREDSRARVCCDDRIYALLRSRAFQAPFADPGDPMYWIPLLARLMGLREEEACQLGLDDFGRDQGIPYLDIRRIDGNNVKTLDSQRQLPIHPTLIELGLLHLVALRKRAGSHRLFIHLTRGKTKGTFSENFSKNFTYYRKSNGCYWVGLDLHAMRTTFNSDLMNLDRSDAIRCRLMGHEPPDEGARSYAQGLSLKTLYDRICDVKLDVSMISSPFADTAGPSQKVVELRPVSAGSSDIGAIAGRS